MKLDFSTSNCNQINSKDIICCSLGLNKSEYEIFHILLNISKSKLVKDSNLSITSEYLSSELNLDKANTQRYLKNLTEKELVIRNKHNLSSGGYTYIYSLYNLSAIKKRILSNTKQLIEKVESEIDHIC